MNIKEKDFKELVRTTFVDALIPIIKQQVAEAVGEIPFRVRQELDFLLGSEFRKVLRDKINKGVEIDIHVKG